MSTGSIDETPPIVAIDPLSTFSETVSPTVTWSASDAETSVESYDVDTGIDGAPWSPLFGATTATSASVSAAEGQTIHLRVRARDTVGNVSDWSETQTVIDAIEPNITFGEPSTPGHGVLTVPVSVSNVGAPIVSSSFAFNDDVGGTRGALTPTVTYRNLGNTTTRPELTVFTTDAIGRTVRASRTYTAPPRWLPLRLRIAKIKTSGKRLKVSGTVAKGFTGYVTVSIKRRSRAGTRKASRRVRARAGKFSASLRARRGSYRVTVATKTTGDYLSASRSRLARVR